MPSTVAPLVDAGKVNCEGECAVNDAHTERLRRVLQSSMTYGSEAFLARHSGVCLHSAEKQIEGSQRMSAPLLRSRLLLESPDEVAELVSLWLGLPLRHQP